MQLKLKRSKLPGSWLLLKCRVSMDLWGLCLLILETDSSDEEAGKKESGVVGQNLQTVVESMASEFLQPLEFLPLARAHHSPTPNTNSSSLIGSLDAYGTIAGDLYIYPTAGVEIR